MIALLILQWAIGCVFRRSWGGWHVPAHMIKVAVGYVLAVLVGFLSTHSFYAALAFGAIIGSAFLNTLHSWGMGMGFDRPGKSTLACAAIMGGSYGAFTLGAAVAVWIITGQLHWLYALSGFSIPLAYILSWLWAVKRGYLADPTKFRFFKIGGEWFIDAPTAIGECYIGLVLLSLSSVPS